MGWPLLGPIDPNEMVGPAGAQPDNRVPPTVPMDYQVKFENVGNATAQEIVVTNSLGTSFDWSTVHFTSINYGGRTIAIPNGVLAFNQVDLPPADGCVLAGSGSLAVRVSLAFDAGQGINVIAN